MTSLLIEKLLIANRGEIACRIIRTCRRLGVYSIALYSDADANSPAARLADEAIHIGDSAPAASYLNIGAILDAARKTGANAIHPGYGFLAENDAFADACAHAGFTFIGPPAAAIRAMGSKSAAKRLMQHAGVPLIPGYHGEDQAAAHLHEQANRIGYPVLIKASAGGGGKGMRVVEDSADFAAALLSCKREAALSFGDDSILIERYIHRPRHIEIQIFADRFGSVVSLSERDCSVQRRHQKVIEEAPAPGISAALRDAMSKAACDAARAVSYVGAGTVEFLVGLEESFYFMEMNTRIQVEHPVTECITGLDLVEWQLRVAAGEPLPLRQEQISLQGHAIEARIYAEDPDNEFLPSIGVLTHLLPPVESSHVRVDTGVEQGNRITPFYDPMIAKLIVWDETRELALGRMERALGEYQIAGVANNVEFLQRIITSPSFTQGDLDTSLLEREADWLHAPAADPPQEACLFAALELLCEERQAENEAGDPGSPWSLRDGWRISGTFKRKMLFLSPTRNHSLVAEYLADSYRITYGEDSAVVRIDDRRNNQITATIAGRRLQATVVRAESAYSVFFAGRKYVYQWIDPLANEHEHEVQDGGLAAPMPGRIVTLLVAAGDHVAKGDPLLVLEAMKMEYTVKAPASGSVQQLLFAVGDQVAEGTPLLVFERDDQPDGVKSR